MLCWFFHCEWTSCLHKHVLRGHHGCAPGLRELCRLLYMCTATRGQRHGQTTKALEIIKDTNVWNNLWFGFIVTFSYGQSNLQLYGGEGGATLSPCFDHTPVLLILFASSIIWDKKIKIKKSTHHKRISISSSPVSADSSTAADVSSLGVVGGVGGVDGKMWPSGADAPVWFTCAFSVAELSEEVSSDSASVGVSSPWTRKPESARDKIITSSHHRYSVCIFEVLSHFSCLRCATRFRFGAFAVSILLFLLPLLHILTLLRTFLVTALQMRFSSMFLLNPKRFLTCRFCWDAIKIEGSVIFPHLWRENRNSVFLLHLLNLLLGILISWKRNI